MLKQELEFWEYVNEKPKILHSKLIEFLELKGFYRVDLTTSNYLLVKKEDNILTEVSEAVIIRELRSYLEHKKKRDIFELFAKGLSSYISKKKLELLKNVDLIDDKDGRDTSNFYFQNCFCQVTRGRIDSFSYNKLPFAIWKNRILKRDFHKPDLSTPSQFEDFCKKITGSDTRLKSLMSILGYLLHRNKENGETVAIILYDEKMGLDNIANGGTGKTLLSQALSECREVELFNGKEIKNGSWFQFQRIKITTDILVYDDLKKDISLELFYSLITTGVEVEKKRQHSFYIDFKDSPKLLITSNYVVKGPKGTSNERRRFEFELLNTYNLFNTPEKDFGNRFFGNHWAEEEWNKFYFFMFNCVQLYLNEGLVSAQSININKNRLEDTTCKEFVEFTELMIEYNKWMNKRDFDDLFKKEYPEYKYVSSKMITKWLVDYSSELGGKYHSKSTGGKYLFIIKMNKNEKKK